MVTPVMLIVYSVKLPFSNVTVEADNVPLEILSFNVVFSSLAFQAPALKVKVASPVKLRVGVVALPNLELVPNLAHCEAAYPITKFHPVLSADMSYVVPDIPLHFSSLPPVLLHSSKVSSKIVVVCPHALLPNTREATISRQRRDIVIPFLQKSFSINFYF